MAPAPTASIRKAAHRSVNAEKTSGEGHKSNYTSRGKRYSAIPMTLSPPLGSAFRMTQRNRKGNGSGTAGPKSFAKAQTRTRCKVAGRLVRRASPSSLREY